MNVVLAARNPSGLDNVANEIKASGEQVVTVPTDISDFDALKHLVSIAEADFGTVDILVNNAALDNPISFHKERPEVIEQMIATNLTAPILLSRLVVPVQSD